MLRSLERSRAEQLRLVSARHHGALGRLTERRREKNRRRKHELRERLAAAKSGVARAWKDHNRCLFLGAGRASEKRCAARESGGPLDKRAAAKASAPVPVVGPVATAVAEAVAAVAAGAAATGSGENEAESQCQAGEVGELRGHVSTADAKVAADGGFVCANQIDAPPRTPPGQGCDSVPRAREAAAPEAVGGKTRAFAWSDSTADTTSTRQKKQLPRRAATLSPAATSTAFLRGRGRSRGRENTAGVPARKPQKRRAASTSTTNTSDESPELPTTTTAAFAATAFVSGAVGVLSEEEVQALAALGRGTPNDPRLLLVASRPPPESRARVEVPRPTRKALMVRTRGTQDDADFYCDKKIYRNSDGGSAVGTAVRGRGNSVLERAMDKLVPEMRAREEATRRSFGMPSLASS